MAACSVAGFLPLKCPLAAGTEAVDEGDTFTVSMFMERQISDKRSIGLCIDLTSPSAGGKRLYESTEWDDWDVAHVSIPCAPPMPAAAAAGELPETLPAESVVEKFVATAGAFWGDEKNRSRFIAVHCVTGINTAGYLIARYLMRVAPLERGLKAIAAARPPGVYCPRMLEALWAKAEGATPTAEQRAPPEPPEWHKLRNRAPKPPVPLFDAGAGAAAGAKRAADDAPAAGTDGAPAAKAARLADGASVKPAAAAPTAPTGPDPLLLGGLNLVSGAEKRELQTATLRLMRIAESDRFFPGSQPVSFERHNLTATTGDSLRAKRYMAAEKTDGVRYMLLALGAKGAFMIDRNFELRRLPPSTRLPSRAGAPLDGTLLDGELIADTRSANSSPDSPNSPSLRFLVYDACSVGGTFVMGDALPQRLLRVRRDVLAPRYAAIAADADGAATSSEAFSIDLKVAVGCCRRGCCCHCRCSRVPAHCDTFPRRTSSNSISCRTSSATWRRAAAAGACTSTPIRSARCATGTTA